MGAFNNKLLFSEYHCSKCGSIPSISFKDTTLDIICEEHNSLDIPINKFQEYISFSFECSNCKSSTLTKGIHVFYCFDCEKSFCNKCKLTHDKTTNNNHFIVKAKRKNNYCKKHKLSYDKYCSKCKKNLCELCEPHTGHKIMIFKNILPNLEQINIFLLNSTDLKKLIKQNDQNNKLILETIEAKEQLVNTYKIQNTNYNYINNINNIIKPKYEVNSDLKREFDKINIEKKIISKSTPIIITKKINSVWCMKELNKINFKENNNNKIIELVAVGCENEIILFNLLDNFIIYQTICEHNNIVYSLAQYNDNEEYLFSSSGDKSLNIYKLNDKYNYILMQKLKKKGEKTGGEIGKVITLSNKLLLSGDHRSLTIWKQKKEKKEVEFEEFYNILINEEVCNLLEMTTNTFISAKSSIKGSIQIYQNDEKEFPLVGEIDNIQLHNSTTNGLSKINNKLFCAAGAEGNIYIICIDPIEIKLKILIKEKKDIFYIYSTKNNYIYCSSGEKDIIQYKIIYKDDKNEENIELFEVGRKNIYSKGLIKNNFDLSQYNSWDVRAIIPFENGNIFVESFEKKFILLS